MPSGPRRSRPDPPKPVFFLDRALGRVHVAGALRARGFEVHLMAEVYPHGADERIADDDWIQRASSEGWVALTKDYAIVRDHEAALAESSLRVFCLGRANLTGPEMADRFDWHLNRIVQHAAKRGPFLYVVHADRVERRWPAT